jgi:hypothetical protein
MKQLENSMGTHGVYAGTFDMRSISYSANVNAIFEFLPCARATVTHRRRLWPTKFVLEGMLASEIGTLGLSHIPIRRSSMK